MEKAGFASGFSNMELGGYLELENAYTTVPGWVATSLGNLRLCSWR